ncbi:MAG: DEAD/DEAH box helicase, partial [Nanoarchaeota archaeon]
MKSFKELGLNKDLLKVIHENGFDSPTDIQEKAIPLVLEGKDVIGESATGSGKTLVFGAGIIQHLKKQGFVQALILTPTRELAEQDSSTLKKFSKYNPLEIIPIYGGVDINNQIRFVNHADVVVGTPGRILDHLYRRTLDLRKIKILVLDEADRMLDMGFQEDVEKI